MRPGIDSQHPACYTDSVKNIQAIIKERTLAAPGCIDDIKPYVDEIRARYGDRVLGVYMYGSVLSAVTCTETSFPDFFVITDGYRGVFRKWSHRLLAYFLPPHIYHLRLDKKRRCKYNLVSLRRFRRECSKRAKDIYILGRFGKRVALVYHRDEKARDELVGCCFSAMRHVVTWTLRGMKYRFDEEEFTLNCLNLSYAGETRVEASSKVPKLFQSEKPFYLEIYPALLRKNPLALDGSNGEYQLQGNSWLRGWRRFRFRMFLKRSRIRGILRWPKFLVTVDEWVDIILAKIERSKGIKLDVTERQRRHPIIFGWPHFFRLLRSGAIRSKKKID